MELTKVGVKKRKITIQPSSREIMKESIILTTDLLSAHLRVEISFHQMRTGTTVHTNRQTGCSQFRDPTTSFLTATNLIYAIGAGITAGAGTRLVLQLLLIKGFKLYSFQLQSPYWDLYCYFLSLPPWIRIG